MIKSIYNYFDKNAVLADEYNKLLLTFLGAISLNVDYEFTFKDKKLILNIEPEEKELTSEDEYKLFCINKNIGIYNNVDELAGFLRLFYEKGPTWTDKTSNIVPYFKDLFAEYEKSYKNYTYNQVIYLKPNVFYTHFDEKLTDEEIETLKKVNSSESNHFEVYKDEKGEIWFF